MCVVGVGCCDEMGRDVPPRSFPRGQKSLRSLSADWGLERVKSELRVRTVAAAHSV